MGSKRILKWVIVYKKIKPTSTREMGNAVGWEGLVIIQFVKHDNCFADARLPGRDVRDELNEINVWN